MSWLAAFLAVYCCGALLRRTEVLRHAKIALRLLKRSAAIVGSKTLHESDKERLLQKNSILCFRIFARMLAGVGISIAVPIGVVSALSATNVLSHKDVIAVCETPAFLIVSGVMITVHLALPSSTSRQRSDYSKADKALHYWAFRTPSLQLVLSDLETAFLSKQLDAGPPDRPVFITSLPRAGTTLLLELLSTNQSFVYHTYRDMPFVRTPWLWNRYAARFAVDLAKRERAHKDGVLVDADSPEAFEETLWMPFWKSHYDRDQITAWDESESSEEFLSFFREHVAKLGVARDKGTSGLRYLSKNNANISRISQLSLISPTAAVIIAFRSPLFHCTSLLSQHRNFLNLQRDDPFVLEYMTGIGHFDFGRNLKPINFDDWIGNQRYDDPTTLNFWLEYWVATYKSLMRISQSRVYWLGFESLCAEPRRELECLSEFLQIKDPNWLNSATETVRPGGTSKGKAENVDHKLLSEAMEVHEALLVLAGRKSERALS